MSQQETLKQFTHARSRGVPLVAVESPDVWAFARGVAQEHKGEPVFTWDLVGGLSPITTAAEGLALAGAGSIAELGTKTASPTAMLKFVADMPGALVLAVFFHRSIDNGQVVTLLSRFRDTYAEKGVSFAMLCPSVSLPEELAHDFLVLTEELPEDDTLKSIVDELVEAAELSRSIASQEVVRKTAVGLRGLSAFEAGQSTALALGKKGVDFAQLWSRREKAIAAVHGLKLERPGLTFDAIRGLSSVRNFTDGIFAGDAPPELVIRIDEIEKSPLAGATDSHKGSQVAADALGVFLQAVEDEGWDMMLGVGPGGSGKSLLTKTMAATYGVPGGVLDFGAMQDQYVGNSQRRVRAAINTMKGLGRGRILFIATCNKLTELPPELKRRFTYGIWFFDLPDEQERLDIFRLYMGVYGLAQQNLPLHTGWSGAEIRNCCKLAKDRKSTLVEAAGFIVPISRSDPEALASLRKLAADRAFLSANYPGSYVLDKQQWTSAAAVKKPGGRKITL